MLHHNVKTLHQVKSGTRPKLIKHAPFFDGCVLPCTSGSDRGLSEWQITLIIVVASHEENGFLISLIYFASCPQMALVVYHTVLVVTCFLPSMD